MDSMALALSIRSISPKTTVLYRAYNPSDSKWHEVVTPQEWLNIHKPFSQNGVVVVCYNEPSSAGLFAALPWLEQVVTQCPADMTLALPNCAVGNPNEQDILSGKYDRLLRLVCGTRHKLALHEYFRSDPLTEAPYFCGRFKFWLERAAALGLPTPDIIITEHGRDLGGGRNDGWKGQGWSEDDYYARLVKARDLYKPYGIPVCVFSYGYGANNDWASFDVQDAPGLLAKMADYQEQDMTYPPGTSPAQKRINHTAGLKLRTDPALNGAILGVMPYREEVTVYADPVVKADTYFWQRVAWGSREGWAANAVNGVASFVNPIVQKLTLIRPVACDNLTNHPFNEPRDYDGDGIKDDKHEGLDIVPTHSGCHPLVIAAADGVVQDVSNKGDYGNHVKVRHEVGGEVYVTWYCHLDAAFVKVGDALKAGGYIGAMGSTGNSTGMHLHFNLQWIGKGLSGYVIPDAVDPALYFTQAPVALAA